MGEGIKGKWVGPVVSGLAQVDFGIVPDIQAAGLSFYFGVTADKGMGKDDVIEIGEGAYNGIFYNGVVDAGFFPDSDVGAYDGIADITAGGDADRLEDDGIFELVFRGDVAAELLE